MDAGRGAANSPPLSMNADRSRGEADNPLSLSISLSPSPPPPPSHSSSPSSTVEEDPLRNISFSSAAEEDAQFWADHLKEEAEWIKVRDRRAEAEAKERGFSSFKEFDKYFNEICRQGEIAYDKRMDEQCALRGMTRDELVDELMAQDPQRDTSGDYGMGKWCKCDCDDHPIPFFCAKSLVEYRSMDQSYWMGCLEQRKRTPIEDLEIMQSHRSRRLPSVELERAWTVNSPDNLRDIPPWFKADKVIQQIMGFGSPSPPIRSLTSINGSARLISPRSSDVAMGDTAPATATTSGPSVPKLEEQIGQTPSDNKVQNHQSRESSTQKSLHKHAKARAIRTSPQTKLSRAEKNRATNAKIREGAQRPAKRTRYQDAS